MTFPRRNTFEELHRMLARTIPKERLIRDPLRTLAYGTDASFYRLIPKIVVRVQSEPEVIATMRACSELGISYVFRGAGTSLSGQAITDSVLIQISPLWNSIELNADHSKIRLQPGVLGGDANRALAPYGRKIGPDPASIDSAMIGGIVANNASGMCCGNIQDSYHTIAAARMIFSDGSILDTGCERSRRNFRAAKSDLVGKVYATAARVKANPNLSQRIRHKYRIKNTTGYSLNALLDFDDPLDIIAHLLIGSEGTLGFFSEVTYKAVIDPPFRATGLVLFANLHAACEAAYKLGHASVAAVELMDRQSLRSVANKPGMPTDLTHAAQDITALLVEICSDSTAVLDEQLGVVRNLLGNSEIFREPLLTKDKEGCKRLWDIRKGLFPSLGYARRNGTTIIIEDIAFAPERMADAAVDLRRLLAKYRYEDAALFGHALQGNLHFVFCVDFNEDAEVRRYASFLEDLTELVTQKYDGSLKAEHGTGRNMAPFVKREWGAQAYSVMREIKQIFDVQNLMNPGVILSDDPSIHVSHLKHMPASHSLIQKCTECGFCERSCPSRHLTLTPRQRITAWREISHLARSGTNRNRLRRLRKDFIYAGDQTCAVDGLCGTLCPLGIDTGSFIKELRGLEHGPIAAYLADAVAGRLALVLSGTRHFLNLADKAHSLLGTRTMLRITKLLRRMSGRLIPEWNPWLPKPSSNPFPAPMQQIADKVVCFTSCVSRVFGCSAGTLYQYPQHVAIDNILAKAGFTAVYPTDMDNLCCGMAFSSKGFTRQGDRKAHELLEHLTTISQNGEYSIVIDTSPCAQRMKAFAIDHPELPIYDISTFLLEVVAPRLHLQKRAGTVAVHIPCSLRKTAQAKCLIDLAKLCAEHVHVPDSILCCGFAGDRGFTTPELTASALVTLKSSLPEQCTVGYSTSRTCEIGMSNHSGISYQSIAYLVDEAAVCVAGANAVSVPGIADAREDKL